MFVDRCVCHQVLFTTLNEMVERDHDTQTESTEQIFDNLQKRTKCSTSCALCRPYILRMIETGRTSFTPFPPEQR